VIVPAILLADGHGNMNKPCSWYDPECKLDMPHFNDGPIDGYQAIDFFSNFTFIPGERTLPDAFITYAKGPRFSSAHLPWFAPGSAPVWSPCGFSGGNPKGCPAGDKIHRDCPGGGYAHGIDARMLQGNKQPTVWTAGDAVEVAWGVRANHGGGYSYRLCRKTSAQNIDLTEQCFQASTLQFDGDTQWIQFGADEKNRTAISAMRTTSGTTPRGSQWTRNPIPACVLTSCADTQFPQIAATDRLHDMSIVDRVQVPRDLASGDYVLSFRWDCEQTPQIWSACADIRIEGGRSAQLVV